MGIDLNQAQLLIKAHKSGVSFERMATLGRLTLWANRPALVSILCGSGYELAEDRRRKLLDPTTKFSEDFFAVLGAKEVTAIDASDYEGAQIIHDMNRPIPVSMISSYDVVLDGGTLEHVFDFPTAIRNVSQMVRPGGRFITHTMANNFCGHGFYQFSPELFYRFFCPANGYAVESCVLWEETPGSQFYEVPDPDSIQSRIELTSAYGTIMSIQAKRVGDVSLDFIPQQSDYVRVWGQSAVASLSGGSGAKSKTIIRHLRSLFSDVLFIRNLPWPGPQIIAARSRRMRIKRNDRGFLKPLRDIRVSR